MGKNSGPVNVMAEIQSNQTTFTPRLKLLSALMRYSNGYLVIIGYVLNNGSRELANILATAEYYSKNGVFFKTADSLLDQAAVPPRIVSSFSIITVYNPDLDYAKLSFNLLTGQSVPVTGDTAVYIDRTTVPKVYIDHDISKQLEKKIKNN